jgi:hypothetical protein
MSPVQRAIFAKEALEVTGEAFETVRERMLKAVLDADSEAKAWQALLALRGLEAARRQLMNFVDTGTIEREAANRRAAD